MEKQQYIEAGKIVNTHGVRGEVKIQVWLDSPEFMRRFKTIYIDSRPVKLVSSRAHKGFLICCIHWGQEYQTRQNREQEQLADWLLAHGVTHIIGSHPHVVQPIEVRGTEQARM